MSSGRRQRGFTYLAGLLAVAVIGAGLAATSELWSQSRQREQEQELLFVGNQLRQAIALYDQRTPGAAQRYPANWRIFTRTSGTRASSDTCASYTPIP
jgi:type II secretory pathway pseudopilin PulG